MNEQIEAWLNAPQHRLALRFPPALEQRFEHDTGAERCRSVMVLGLVGFVLGLALFPILQADVPDIAWQCRLLYLGIAMPIALANGLLMWFQPPPVLRESLVLSATASFACIGLYLFGRSREPNAPLFVAGVEVLLVYSAIGIQLRFRYALAAMVIIITAYAIALHAHPEIPEPNQHFLVGVVWATAGYLMVANWRLERSYRRNYLLMLGERKQCQDLSLRNIELDELARHDPLTGLANRRAYDSWLAACWAQEGARPGGHLGLIVLDVDRFKAFNDFYGHAAGDSCLKKIAVCLREQLRGTTDLVARLGGEEFAVLVPGLSEANCADVAERMRLAVQRLELPHSGLGPHGLVTISAGVASFAVASCHSPASLFEAADTALYEAKMSGRNQVCVATREPAMPEADRLALPLPR